MIGGLVGGAAAWAGINYGLEQPTPQIQVLQTELADLRSQMDAGPAGGGGEVDLEPLQTAIAETQSRLDQIESAPSGSSQDVSEVQDRLQSLETQLADLSTEIEQAAQSSESDEAAVAGGADLSALQAEIEELTTRVGDVEQAASEGGGSADAVASLESQVGEISARLDEVQSNVTAAAGSGAAEQLRSITGEVESLRGEVGGRLEGVSGRVEGVQGALTALTERMESLAARVDTLEAEIEATKERVDEVGLQRENAASIALATSRVRAAIEDGEPYADALDLLTPVEDPAVGTALEGLQPAAGEGVKTMAELRSEFDEIANELAEQAQASGDSGGLFGRAAGNLMSLVSVRRVGEDVEGSGPGAVVARAEAQLEAGNLEGAVEELNSLPEVPEAAATWLDHAQARLDALKAQNALEAHASELLTEARS